MELDPLLVNIAQGSLFPLGDTHSETLALYPQIWSAAEALTHADLSVRHAGLERLTQLGAVRLSPLVAYLAATRLTDPDFLFRCKIIKNLADVFTPDAQGQLGPDAVRQSLMTTLSQLNLPQVYALLDVAQQEPGLTNAVTTLLSQCPAAGGHLVTLLSDRKEALARRKLAAYFIGEVGYVQAISDLERLADRLTSRSNGLRPLAFTSQDEEEETALVASIQNALNLLKAP